MLGSILNFITPIVLVDFNAYYSSCFVGCCRAFASMTANPESAIHNLNPFLNYRPKLAIESHRLCLTFLFHSIRFTKK